MLINLDRYDAKVFDDGNTEQPVQTFANSFGVVLPEKERPISGTMGAINEIHVVVDVFKWVVASLPAMAEGEEGVTPSGPFAAAFPQFRRPRFPGSAILIE